MTRLFCTHRQQSNFIITGQDAHHLARVLRISLQDPIVIADGLGYDYHCIITSITKERILATIQNKVQNRAEPTLSITLYQALPKGEKFDLIIQKMVELGIARITPVITSYCVSRPNLKTIDKKQIRWQKIAKSAAEQAGRGIIPVIDLPISFTQLMNQIPRYQQNILCYEKGGAPLGQLISSNITTIGLIIGAEGGFNSTEITLAKQHHISIATLGNRILRCETAPIVATSILMHLTGNL